MNAAAPTVSAHTAHLAQVQESRIRALERRAAQHSGATRAVIDAQLQHLRNEQAANEPADLCAAPANRVSPLAALVAQLARHTPAAGELKAVRDYRGTWVQLGVQQRLTQTLAKVPDNAGPLNTQRLMHQALKLMGDCSPAYLQHFMAHVDALLALDQLNPPAPPPRKDGTRSPRGG